MTDATLATETPAKRRRSKDRWSIEFIFESLLRPANWAARLSYALGLQGHVCASEITLGPKHAEAHRPRRPLRIAFGSDFHAGGMTDDRTLEQACATLAELEPDVLLLGGDFVTSRAVDVERIAPLLAEIPAPLGKFAVLGNHDLYVETAHVEARLESAGITVLTNSYVRLADPFGDVVICGLDDALEGNPLPHLALDGVEGTRIVLMHSPDVLTALGDREFDLALCGHTHGGQIALPWGTPIIVPGGRLSRRYCRGRYQVGCNDANALLVSRGIGCSALPLRLFAAPEVHLCLIT
jgi:predicted MPP superfamily phosphohydrolase